MIYRPTRPRLHVDDYEAAQTLAALAAHTNAPALASAAKFVGDLHTVTGIILDRDDALPFVGLVAQQPIEQDDINRAILRAEWDRLLAKRVDLGG